MQNKEAGGRSQRAQMPVAARARAARSGAAARKKYPKHSSIRTAFQKGACSTKMTLGRFFMGRAGDTEDIGVQLLQILPATHLIVCSMVSRALLRMVDCYCQATFSHDLMWWFSYTKWDPSRNRDEVLGFDEDEQRFELQASIDGKADHTLWMLNVSLAKNAIIKMRTHIQLPADNANVVLAGETTLCKKILQKGIVSVDVLKWRVLSFEQHLPGQYSVLMSAVDFAHNCPRVQLELRSPVVLTLLHAPLQRWPYRSLWVMRGVRRCMHCHERWRAVQSFDVQVPNHRVLCSQCLDLLYARESQLTRKWRVRPAQLPTDKVPRFSFVSCYIGAAMTAHPPEPERHVLKHAVAQAMRCKDWVDFIQQNHRKKKVSRSVRERYLFNTRWW